MTLSIRYRFSAQQRLRTRAEFQYVQTKGRPFYTRYFTVIVYSTPTAPFSRLGIITSRRYGSAVQRSRIRRLIRELFRLHQFQFHLSCDLLIIPKACAQKVTNYFLREDLLNLWKKAHLFKD